MDGSYPGSVGNVVGFVPMEVGPPVAVPMDVVREGSVLARVVDGGGTVPQFPAATTTDTGGLVVRFPARSTASAVNTSVPAGVSLAFHEYGAALSSPIFVV